MIDMNPSMDDRHILAEMERRLSQEDPELAALMDALNQQFLHEDEDSEGWVDDRVDDSGRRFDWRWKAGIACTVIAVLGLLLTAILTATPPSADDKQGPPNSRLPATSVHSQRRAAGCGGGGGGGGGVVLCRLPRPGQT
ncbi:hypothetical protein ABTX34_27265, partial [Streptomyces sp. NPDC096538]|uniref:hypothetical protein n=1 Tax=Streptomyces sp. NPDC096538 TaxID=3155427 RepID=UPI0033186D73